MRTEILKILIDHKGTYVSGDILLKATGISRQGVWKHIQALIDQGYHIESSKGMGYILMNMPTDQGLTQTSLELLVEQSAPQLDKIWHFKTLGSTNAYLKDQARKVTQAIAVADEQTAGRGRLGRNWESQANGGLWFSLLLRPPVQPSKASMLTQVVAASMAKSLSQLGVEGIQIKWPNDLMINSKKVCGILTEMSAELTAIEYVVVGIGLNLNQMQFEPPLDQIATSILLATNNSISREAILSTFLSTFMQDYNQFILDGDLRSVLHLLNEKSFLNNSDIMVLQAPERNLKALGVTVLGELQVCDQDGTVEHLTYGEVSVRRKDHATGI